MADLAPPPYSDVNVTSPPTDTHPALQTGQPSTSGNPFVGNASNLAAQIHASAPQREALLQTLRNTDYAPPALQQQRASLDDLRGQLSTVEGGLRKLREKSLKEFKEHEKYRDSIMKRFTYRATGRREKFEERAAKEEREYFDALHEEHQANELKRGIEANIKETEEEVAKLEGPAESNVTAKREIDQLYSSIFGGTTQGHPEEDAREAEYNQAVRAHQEATAAVELERETVRALRQAHGFGFRCHEECNIALDYSRADVWGAGTMADYMERDHLEKANTASGHMLRHIDRAQHMNPEVKPLPLPNIDSGHLLSDMLFDDVFSNLRFHDKIKNSLATTEAALNGVKAEEASAEARKKQKKAVAKQRADALDQARTALFRARDEVFEKTVQNTALFD